MSTLPKVYNKFIKWILQSFASFAHNLSVSDFLFILLSSNGKIMAQDQLDSMETLVFSGD